MTVNAEKIPKPRIKDTRLVQSAKMSQDASLKQLIVIRLDYALSR